MTIQSFRDVFELGNKNPKTPADPGSVLVKADDKDNVLQKRQTYYRSGVGKLLHMTGCPRPDIQKFVRYVSRQGSVPVEAHVKTMHMIMKYIERTKYKGWTLKSNRRWNGKDTIFKFKIKDKSDSNYANRPTSRCNISGKVVLLEDTVVALKIIMQKIVAL